MLATSRSIIRKLMVGLLATKTDFKLSSRFRLPSTIYCFSNLNAIDKVQHILQNIKITIQQKETNLLSSKIINKIEYDEKAQRLKISVDMKKDFPRIRNLLTVKMKQNGFHNIEIIKAENQEHAIFQKNKNLTRIKRTIGVVSSREGVGKTEIATNFAFTLSQLGYKVGIFDANIDGLSLPIFQTNEPANQTPKTKSSGLKPKLLKNVKYMCAGLITDKQQVENDANICSTLSHALLQTEWGKLDYLIVDIPSSFSNINKMLSQQLKFEGVIIVTSPKTHSFLSFLKQFETAQDLNARVLTVVDNMAFHQCAQCSKQKYIFGQSFINKIKQQLGIQNALQIPILPQISEFNVPSTPVPFLPQRNNAGLHFQKLCQQVVKQLQKPKNKAGVYYNTGQRKVIAEQGQKIKKINPLELRSKCRCSQCIGQGKDKAQIKSVKLDPEVYPTKIQRKGNYAIAVTWSDGHKNSIYSFKRLFSSDIESTR